jgi:hypothetical protein
MANQPITIVNRFPAGAGNDIVLRMDQEALEKDMGQLEKAPAKVSRAIPGTGRQISASIPRRTTGISSLGCTKANCRSKCMPSVAHGTRFCTPAPYPRMRMAG